MCSPKGLLCVLDKTLSYVTHGHSGSCRARQLLSQQVKPRDSTVTQTDSRPRRCSGMIAAVAGVVC